MRRGRTVRVMSGGGGGDGAGIHSTTTIPASNPALPAPHALLLPPARTRGPAEAAQVELGGNLHRHHAVLLDEVQRHLAKGLVPHHHARATVGNGLDDLLNTPLLAAAVALQLLGAADQHRALHGAHSDDDGGGGGQRGGVAAVSTTARGKPRLCGTHPSKPHATHSIHTACNSHPSPQAHTATAPRRRQSPLLALVSVLDVSTPWAKTATLASATRATDPSTPRFSTMPCTTCES